MVEIAEFVSRCAKRSDVWDHFGYLKQENVIIKQKVVCKICHAILPYSGNTTNMRAHIDRNHWSTKEHKSVPKLQSAKVETETQQTVPSLFQQRSPYSADSARATAISQSIADFLILDMKPLGTVECSGFKQMMSVIEPRYKVVSRNHILEKYIVPRYQTTMLDVKSELSIAKRHAFTTDAWTSLNMDSFITTTCHYINPQTFQLQSRVLDTKSVQTRHSAENLAEEMRSVVEKWGLKDPVSVTDNAANVVNACKDAGYPHIGCFRHTLNLAVNKCMAVNEVNALLGKCRKLVSVFKQSYIKTIALHSAQAALEMRQLQVIQDVDTRWNSALAMISRLFDILPAVWATLYKDSKYSHLLPTDNDRRNMEDLRTLLSPMETATNKVSSEKNPTASFILPILERLLAHDLAPKETDSTFIKKAKESMRNDLLKRYKKDEEQTILNMATVVDPRFKDLQWMNSIGRVGVYDRLKTEMLQVEKIELVSVKAENLDNEPVPVKQEEKDKDTPDLPSLPEIEKESEIETGELSNSQNDKKSSPEKKKARKEQETSETKDDFFDVLFVKADKSEISKEAIIDAEIQRYKAEPTVPMNQDPLEWWQNQRFLIPSWHLLFLCTYKSPPQVFHQNGFFQQQAIF